MISFARIREVLLTVKEPSASFPFGLVNTLDSFQAAGQAHFLKEWLIDLRQTAKQASELPIAALLFTDFIQYEAAGTRQEYEIPYFNRRSRLASMVFTSVVDGTDVYIPAVENMIWEICNEFTWSIPAHLPQGADVYQYRLPAEQIVDLMAAETAHALAETLYLLKDRLNKKIEIRVRHEIEQRVFGPVFEHSVHFWWESARTNWASVCAGAIGMAALLLEDDRERLAGMMERVIRAMECFLEGYSSDGGCPEGIAYWSYGFGYYVYFADMLYHFSHGELDLLQGEKFKRIAEFPLSIGMSGQTFVNYSDAAAIQEVHSGMVCKLAERLGSSVIELNRVPAYHSDNCYRFAHISRNLLWTEAKWLNQPWQAGTFYLPDLCWVMDRRGLAGVPIAFSAKGGHNNESHNQNDLGHFILHFAGESVLADLGAGLYTREYFGLSRDAILHVSSEGHSVPLINGKPQKSGRDFAASVVKFEQEAEGLLLELDLARAYEDDSLVQLSRSFDWSCSPREQTAVLKLTDTFEFNEEPHELEEVFISLHLPELRGNRLVWSLNSGELSLIFNEAEFTAQVEVVHSLDHEGLPLIVYRIRLKALDLRKRMKAAFVFAFDKHNDSEDVINADSGYAIREA